MVRALAEFGLDGPLPDVQLTVDSPLEDRRAFATDERGGRRRGAERVSRRPFRTSRVSPRQRRPSPAGRQRHHAVRQPPEGGPLPALVHLHGGGMAIGSATDAGSCAWPRISRRHRTCRRRSRVPQLRRQARPAPVSGGSQRLRGRCPVDLRQPRRARRIASDRGRRIRRRQSDTDRRAQGQTGRLAGRDRRPLRAVSLPVEPLAEVLEELPSLHENDGYFIGLKGLALLGSLYDPTGEHMQTTRRLGRDGDRRGAGRTAAACHLGQRARSAARRGAPLLPQAGARRGLRGWADGGGHLPRRRSAVAEVPCPTSSPRVCAT